MATNLPVKTIPVQLAAGYCPASYQQFNEDIQKAESYVELGSVSTVITQPGPPDELVSSEAVWLKTDEQGAPVRLYKWSVSKSLWISPHPVPASSPELRMWRGTPDALKTYEGDDQSGLALSPTAGPFWEIVAAVTGRVPIGINSAGHVNAPPVDDTLPGMEPGPNLETGEVTLSFNQIPKHSHPMGYLIPNENDIDVLQLADVSIPATNMKGIAGEGDEGPSDSLNRALLNVFTFDASQSVSSTREITPVTTMPPGYGVYYIGRTIRVYYAET
jgi:hypothetical protein